MSATKYGITDDGKRIAATPRAAASCPVCKVALVPKCGKVKVWHFAHAVVEGCDPWFEPETVWHRRWKDGLEAFGFESEVVVKRHGIKHIADAIHRMAGVIVEFQHSPIGIDEILARTSFYESAGLRMVWVFDASAWRLDLRDQRRRDSRRRGTFRWKWPHKSLAPLWGRQPKPLVYFDRKSLLLRIPTCYLDSKHVGGSFVEEELKVFVNRCIMAGTSAILHQRLLNQVTTPDGDASAQGEDFHPSSPIETDGEPSVSENHGGSGK